MSNKLFYFILALIIIVAMLFFIIINSWYAMDAQKIGTAAGVTYPYPMK